MASTPIPNSTDCRPPDPNSAATDTMNATEIASKLTVTSLVPNHDPPLQDLGTSNSTIQSAATSNTNATSQTAATTPTTSVSFFSETFWLWKARLPYPLRGRYPNVEASAGDQINKEFTYGHRRRKVKVWHAQGPVLEAYRKKHESTQTEISNQMGGGFSACSPVQLQLYMVGESKQTSWPWVLVCSSDTRAQKNWMKALRQHEVFKKEWRGFRISAALKPPQSQGFGTIRLVGKTPSEEDLITPLPSTPGQYRLQNTGTCIPRLALVIITVGAKSC